MMNNLSVIAFLLIASLSGCISKGNENEEHPVESINDLISFWDFRQSDNGEIILTSKGPYNYTLKEMNGPIERADDGIFGQSSLKISRGQWLMIERDDCPALNIHGKQEVTMVAWVKRDGDNHWQYIAGMWDENKKRQYALFTHAHKQTDYTTLERTDAGYQVHGYVSEVGGATPGRPFSFSYASGKSKMEKDVWYMIAYTYDHNAIRVYFNGEFDENGNYNPFYWDKPIFDGGDDGADFTVAQRAHPKWPGYPEVEEPTIPEGFGGQIGGLAVFNRALEPEEIRNIYQATMKNGTP